MILDRGHVRWAGFAAAAFAAATLCYVAYASSTPGGPRGGTPFGLGFGIVGTVFIFFAALLGARKKVPHINLGRAATWLKGHLWLGGLSFPLILFHAGFGVGGTLTTVLMVFFLVVFLTGLYGLLLQQFLPRLMTKSLPQETVYEQIDHVREQLREDAAGLVEGGGGGRAIAKAKSGGVIQGRVVESRAAVEVEVADETREPLRRFKRHHLDPFFDRRGVKGSPLSEPQRRTALLGELERSLSPELHAVVPDLDALCAQRVELEVQRRMHHWLHGWLYVHVPVSMAMVFLTAVHAITALFY